MSDDIIDNYRDLAATTGESVSSIAARVESAGDAATAARIRAELAPADEPKVKKSTRGQRTAD